MIEWLTEPFIFSNWMVIILVLIVIEFNRCIRYLAFKVDELDKKITYLVNETWAQDVEFTGDSRLQRFARLSALMSK